MLHYDQEYLTMTEQFEQAKEELKTVKDLLERSQEDNAKQSRQLEELAAELAIQKKTHKRNSSRNLDQPTNGVSSHEEVITKHLKSQLDTQKTENQKLLEEITELKSKLNVKHKISNSLKESTDSVSTTTTTLSGSGNNAQFMMILYLIVGALVGFLIKYFL